MNLRRTYSAVIGVVICFLMMGSAMGEIEGRGFVANIGAEVSSAYVWRGINKSDELVLAPSLEIKLDKPYISTKLWSNIDLTGAQSGELTETHFTADWMVPVFDFEVTVGGVYYNYVTDIGYAALLHKVDDTWEVFGRIEWMGGIDIIPSVTVYYDMDQNDGIYGEVGFRYAPPNYGDIEYGFSTTLGYATSDWNSYYFDVNDASFVGFDIRGYMTWPISEHVFVSPYAAYSTVVDRDIQRKLVNGATIYIGVGVVMEF